MPDPVAFTIFGWNIYWYGIIIALGMFAAFFLGAARCKKMNMDINRLLDLFIIAIPTGILGARLYYVAFKWDYYQNHLGEILAIHDGGLAIHGGIIAGIIAIAIFTYIKKDNLMKWMDFAAPSLILAQAIGRWGNFFNQEAYGRVTDLPWAMYIDGAYRHPTFLYESIWDLLGCFVLLFIAHKKKVKTGDIAAGYFIFYSVGRFFVESLRTDSLTFGDPLTGAALTFANAIGIVDPSGCLRTAMVVSLIGIALGIGIIIFNRVRKEKTA